jgi:hypothetical protein
MSNYGVSRNNAMGTMSGAYGDIGKAQIAADALAGLNFSMGGGGGGGGGFSATGPSGSIASGSYGGGGGGMNFSGSASRSSSGAGGEQALAGLGSLRDSAMDPDMPNRMDRLGEIGRRQLDDQHYSSRGMPSQMLGQTLSGLMTLQAPAYGQSAAGMNQFYNNSRPNDSAYQSMLGALQGGFNQAGQQIGGVQRDIGGGFSTANRGVRGMFDDTLGRLPEFMTPAQREVASRTGARERQRSRDMSRLDSLTRMAQSPNVSAGRRDWYNSAADRVRRSMGAF